MFTAFVIYLFSCQVVQFWRQTLPMTCLGRVRKLPDFQFGTSKVIRLRRVSLGFRATFHRHSRLESCPNIRTGIWCRIFQCQNKKLQSSTERHKLARTKNLCNHLTSNIFRGLLHFYYRTPVGVYREFIIFTRTKISNHVRQLYIS